MIDVKDIDAIIGADVVDAANDRIGRVSQVYIDSEDQHPSWVSVRTGFFGRSETLIPIDDAHWDESLLHVTVDRAKVREAPHVDPDQELSVDEQNALYRYYGKGTPNGEVAAEPAANAGAAQERSVGDSAPEPNGDAAAGEDRETAGPARDEPASAGEQPADEQPADEQAAAEQPAAEQPAPEQTVAGQPAAEQSADTAATEQPAADAASPQDDGLTAAETEQGAADAAPSGRRARRRSNFVTPPGDGAGEADEASAEPVADDAPADATPASAAAQSLAPEADAAEPDVITRYEERLRVGTERVPSARMRLVKSIVTEHRTISVPVSHEELRLEREPISEEEIASWAGPLGELQEEEREIILMAERPVVSTQTAPIERIRLVREVISEARDIEADVRHEQVDLNHDGIPDDQQ